jgi:hypothetical protein
MSEAIDISGPTRALCDAFGLEYDCVNKIVLEPKSASVTHYRLNESGKKFVDPETNEGAAETVHFEVRT